MSQTSELAKTAQELTRREMSNPVRMASVLRIHIPTSNACVNCNGRIHVMCFKGTGVCSEQCRKAYIQKQGDLNADN